MLIIILLLAGIVCVIGGKLNITGEKIYEDFNPYLNYSRVYPGIFSFKYGFQPYQGFPGSVPDFLDMYPESIGSWPGNIRYNPGFRDYWYIPAQEVLNAQVNGLPRQYLVDNLPLEWDYSYRGIAPDDCIIPPITDGTCVQNEVQRTGNLDFSINKCTVPATISDSCPSKILSSQWELPYLG